jgi:hypothetical protein
MLSSPFEDGALLPRKPEDQRRDCGSPDTDINVLEYCNGLSANAPEGETVRLDLLLERTYLIVTAQAERSFEAACDQDNASAFRALLNRPDFRGPMAWAFLAGSPSGIAVRGRISRLFRSEWVRDALLKNVGVDAAAIHELVARTARGNRLRPWSMELEHPLSPSLPTRVSH